MQFGIIGSGSWATALAKILTDNNHHVYWLVRNSAAIRHIEQRRHNPHYLHSVYFNTALLNLSENVEYVFENTDALVMAVPSAYIKDVLHGLHAAQFTNKKIISAIKGILPDCNNLLNEYLQSEFNVQPENYFTVLGPCHAEEVAAEKLSYLTFSGVDEAATAGVASHFKTDYLNTKINQDVTGVQYAAVMKNIYALGAGIAHGLDYGDNFLSVYIANCASEMAAFLQAVSPAHDKAVNYNTSVYLGDLLVTCYSLYSRNRMFGNMIGKGYSVKAAQLELAMVAEGYNASRCMHEKNETLQIHLPLANIIYNILWKQLPAAAAFKEIESMLV